MELGSFFSIPLDSRDLVPVCSREGSRSLTDPYPNPPTTDVGPLTILLEDSGPRPHPGLSSHQTKVTTSLPPLITVPVQTTLTRVRHMCVHTRPFVGEWKGTGDGGRVDGVKPTEKTETQSKTSDYRH